MILNNPKKYLSSNRKIRETAEIITETVIYFQTRKVYK